MLQKLDLMSHDYFLILSCLGFLTAFFAS